MELLINGKKHTVSSDDGSFLLFVLRDELDMTGTKYGCGEGQCGACTVLLDGKPVRSCRLPLSATEGKEITTIEGLEKEGILHPVQQAYLEVDVFQCGYCAPGMLMSTVGLLKTNPKPSDEEIVKFMNGNICRCGTYPRIISAIKKASKA